MKGGTGQVATAEGPLPGRPAGLGRGSEAFLCVHEPVTGHGAVTASITESVKASVKAPVTALITAPVTLLITASVTVPGTVPVTAPRAKRRAPDLQRSDGRH